MVSFSICKWAGGFGRGFKREQSPLRGL